MGCDREIKGLCGEVQGLLTLTSRPNDPLFVAFHALIAGARALRRGDEVERGAA
jgi:hypothetical protein